MGTWTEWGREAAVARRAVDDAEMAYCEAIMLGVPQNERDRLWRAVSEARIAYANVTHGAKR